MINNTFNLCFSHSCNTLVWLVGSCLPEVVCKTTMNEGMFVWCLYLFVWCLYLFVWCLYLFVWCLYLFVWCLYLFVWCLYLFVWCPYWSFCVVFVLVFFGVCTVFCGVCTGLFVFFRFDVFVMLCVMFALVCVFV